jgi:hypothetical protein
MRGALNEAAYRAEEAVVRDFLKANSSAEHWQKFNASWIAQ